MIYGVLVARSEHEATAVVMRRRSARMVCRTDDGKPVLIVPLEDNLDLRIFSMDFPRPAHVLDDRSDAERLASALYG